MFVHGCVQVMVCVSYHSCVGVIVTYAFVLVIIPCNKKTLLIMMAVGCRVMLLCHVAHSSMPSRIAINLSRQAQMSILREPSNTSFTLGNERYELGLM